MTEVLDRPERARALLEGVEIRSHLALAYALVEGRQGGIIFVDRVRRPRRAIYCGDSGFWFVAGEPDRSFLEEFVLPPIEVVTALYATSRGWAGILDSLYGEPVRRRGFTSEGARARHTELPEGFALLPLDARLAARFSEGVDPWVLGVWGGVARFARESFGYGVVHDGEVVSIGTSCAIGGGEAEMEVGTDPRFRQMGLALAACSAFIDESRRRGLEPAWSCAEANVASAKLAAKLGFREIELIRGYAVV